MGNSYSKKYNKPKEIEEAKKNEKHNGINIF